MTFPTDLTTLRRDLHRLAEPSGAEERTARRVVEELERTAPDELWTGVGGHGVVALYHGAAPGPTVLARSDLDALPIDEHLDVAHGSATPGVAHKCGHDGHTATLVGVARGLGERRPTRGRVALLFQPAEETGAGALDVLGDGRFERLAPDFAVAMHNYPGYPLGQVVLRDGVFASASRGMIVSLQGETSHAAEPELGRSPVAAAATIAQAFAAVPQRRVSLHDAAKVTVVGIEVGGPNFGTTPGEGRVMATLRAHTREVMERVAERCVDIAEGLARVWELDCRIDWVDDFPETANDPRVVAALEAAATDLGLAIERRRDPFAWSEDFGHITRVVPGALFCLGAGEDRAGLHMPDYDFPDELLPIGRDLFLRTIERLLADDGSAGS